jgi:CheY-like chemotaxis protein
MSTTLLLAEDSPDDQFFFNRVLQGSGVYNRVMVTRDGNETIAYLKGEGAFANRDQFPLPGVLFLDLKMAPADGWEVLKWLKTRPDFHKMLVVVLTNAEGTKELYQAYAMGAHSFLIKPLTQLDMNELIQQFPGPWVRSTHASEKPHGS